MNLGARRLRDYLERRRMTQRELAAAVETSEATISRIVNEGSIPDVGLCVRIKQYTDGYVVPEDWTKKNPENNNVSKAV